MKRVITLSTDFGTEDHYSGAMKGVIAGINSEAVIIDITHTIPKFNVTIGALIISNFYSYYPKGTIHVGVVDPGVGSARKPIAVLADGSYFIGPDNGLFSFVYKRSSDITVREIENPDFMLARRSNTFHGRDIFSPAAARLSVGADFCELGGVIAEPATLYIPEPETSDTKVRGEIIHTDTYGNLITNIPGEMIEDGSEVFIGELSLGALKSTYDSVPVGELLSLVGSTGYLEISMNQGSAYEAVGNDKRVSVSKR